VQTRKQLSDFPGFAAGGLIIIGEIRLKSGDFSGAEKAFQQAHELGRDPQPGLALLRLAEGKHEIARELINAALDNDSLLTLERARLLPAQVEIALALDELDTAAGAVEELERIADQYQSPVLHATAAQASGMLALAKGNIDDSEDQMLRAYKLWAEEDVPYEAALARVQLGLAYQKRGAQELARLEFQAAQRMFSKLGAARDLAVTTSLLGEEVEQSAKRVVRTMMFTDIVGSTSLIEAIGDEAWNHLVRWHDQTLRALFDKRGGTENDHAGDGFFVVFQTTAAAIDCAIDIQQTLHRHRAESGFAPQVRIGIHAAEVTETDESRDSGQGRRRSRPVSRYQSFQPQIREDQGDCRFLRGGDRRLEIFNCLRLLICSPKNLLNSNILYLILHLSFYPLLHIS
jgi:tetratricopeptide (TPR) repeat protein